MMIKQLATRRTRRPFWQKPKRHGELRYYKNESGAAVGLLNVKQANGEIKQILSLALPKGASDYTITHELAHVARQAASKTSPKGFDLFLFEASTPNFDPMYWNIFLREETAAHARAARVILTGLEQ
jgi:hypothetical protein